MDDSGSSWKGHDSLSPQLVEYLIMYHTKKLYAFQTLV